MNILIVEDDRTIAMGLEYSLKQENYQTHLCFDFSSAKEAIVNALEEIDLCLFDLSLPDGNGYDLCKMVKQKRDIPVKIRGI